MLRSARLLLLLLSAALLVPRAAFARSLYLCRMLDRVVTTCCCEPRREAHRRERELRASPRDCCERIAPLDAGPTHEGFRHDAGVALALLAVLLAAPSEPDARCCVEAAAIHPGRGPPPAPRAPLFISHCALLI